MFKLLQHSCHSFKGFAAAAGIFSVLVLQLAFTLFLKTSDMFVKSDLLVRTADVALYPAGIPLRNTVAAVTSEEVPLSSSIGDQEVSITPKRFRAETASYKGNRPIQRLSRARARRNFVRVPPKPIFTDTIIHVRYDAAPSQTLYSERSPASRHETNPNQSSASIKTARSDKRTFVATIAPIVKKPYGWVKSIGSKLF